jgi:hypothetical protein
VCPASVHRRPLPGVARDITDREIVDRNARGLEALGSGAEVIEG